MNSTSGSCAWHPSFACSIEGLHPRRKPVAGDVIIFHPDKAIFGEPNQPSNPVLSAIFNNRVFKTITAFAGLDDDVFIKRIVAIEGDIVEVMSALAALLSTTVLDYWPLQAPCAGSHAVSCPAGRHC